MDIFFLISYCISFGLSLITLLLTLYSFKQLKCKFELLPKSLKLYLMFCALPFVVAINFLSMFAATLFFISNSEPSLAMETARTIVAFSAQQIRNSLFVVVIERIIATIFFNKYNLSTKLSMFWWLTVYSYIIATIYTCFSAITLYFPPLQIYKFVTLWIMFFTHFITLIICSVLYYSNQQMYKKFAYQTNLQQRYQIYENIKVLSYIFPPILIYTSIAPFGPVITLISTNIFSYYTPYCTFHIFYNLSFLIVIVHQICVKTLTPVISKNVTSTVINPFGKNLPANVTSEKYFEDLQKQWQ